MLFIIKIQKKGELVQKYSTHKIRRFLKIARLINFEGQGTRVHLRLVDRKQLNVRGKIRNFDNEGYYDKAEDFWFTFNAFMEK